MNYQIRDLKKSDSRNVIRVFNYFIKETFAAYREVEVGLTHFDKVWADISGLPAVAVETEAGEFIGFGHLRPFRQVETLKRTAEFTCFLLPEHTAKGLGTRVLNHLLKNASAMGIDTIIASITSSNEQSTKFHQKNGFVECGRFPAVAIKHGQDFDLLWVVKKL